MIYNRIYEYYHKYVAEHGPLSQGELAEAVGIPAKTLHGYLHNELENYNMAIVERFSEFLDIPIEQFFFKGDRKPRTKRVRRASGKPKKGTQKAK